MSESIQFDPATHRPTNLPSSWPNTTISEAFDRVLLEAGDKRKFRFHAWHIQFPTISLAARIPVSGEAGRTEFMFGGENPKPTIPVGRVLIHGNDPNIPFNDVVLLNGVRLDRHKVRGAFFSHVNQIYGHDRMCDAKTYESHVAFRVCGMIPAIQIQSAIGFTIVAISEQTDRSPTEAGQIRCSIAFCSASEQNFRRLDGLGEAILKSSLNANLHSEWELLVQAFTQSKTGYRYFRAVEERYKALEKTKVPIEP